MPNVRCIGPYRFAFFSREDNEPAHIHVYRDRCKAKFWLDPAVQLASSLGFANHELSKLHRLVVENRQVLLEAWHEHLG